MGFIAWPEGEGSKSHTARVGCGITNLKPTWQLSCFTIVTVAALTSFSHSHGNQLGP